MLDLGCGDGVLLAGLAATQGTLGYGIEIDDANVLASVKNGVNVIQTDLESGLAELRRRLVRLRDPARRRCRRCATPRA